MAGVLNSVIEDRPYHEAFMRGAIEMVTSISQKEEGVQPTRPVIS